MEKIKLALVTGGAIFTCWLVAIDPSLRINFLNIVASVVTGGFALTVPGGKKDEGQ